MDAVKDEALFGPPISKNKGDPNSVFGYKHVIHGTGTKVLDLIL